MAVLEKADFNALKATSPHNFGDIAFVAKRLATDTNTDGGGTFVYDTTVTEDNDDARIIKPNDVLPANPGRWVRRGFGGIRVTSKRLTITIVQDTLPHGSTLAH